ncbi:hypothetical protein [Klebsiella pneumoniae]|uniref:hypothetical protein n=1 Tax=Klebsiella pneumoniae TaxID=573 RepID=UPI00131C690A|nr:hypothetical protein [Klebsiella pneumoniae]
MRLNGKLNYQTPVAEQLATLFPKIKWEIFLPLDNLQRCPFIAREGKLYYYAGPFHHYYVWEDDAGILIDYWELPKTSTSPYYRRALLAARNQHIFRRYLNEALVGSPREVLIEKLRNDVAVMNVTRVCLTFFVVFKADEGYVEAEFFERLYPLHIGESEISFATSGNFKIKGITVKVNSRFRFLHKSMRLEADYDIYPLSPREENEQLKGSMKFERNYANFNWLSSKAFLKENEEMIYHWLRDLDKENARIYSAE